MAKWNSKLFIFTDEKGRRRITTTPPVNLGNGKVRAFLTSGPYRPIAHTAILDDVSTWMADLEKQGFSFEPSSVEVA